MLFWLPYSVFSVWTIQFWLNSYIKEYNLSESVERHASTASKLWNVRESYLSLITNLQFQSINIKNIKERRNDLQKQAFAIYEKAPRTISKAYKEAQKALKFNEELTFLIVKLIFYYHEDYDEVPNKALTTIPLHFRDQV